MEKKRVDNPSKFNRQGYENNQKTKKVEQLKKDQQKTEKNPRQGGQGK